MAQFELKSTSTIMLKDPHTGKYTGEKLNPGTPICITLPDGKFSAGNLFSAAKTNPIILNAVNDKLGVPLTLDQFTGGYWKIFSSKT